MKSPESTRPSVEKDSLSKARETAMRALLEQYDAAVAEAEKHKKDPSGLAMLERAGRFLDTIDRVRVATSDKEVEDLMRPSSFSPEHLRVLDAIFGAGNLDAAEIPPPEEITTAYFDKHYPVRTTKEREADLKKGLVNFRPDWFSKDADADIVGPRPEKWMDTYIRSMKHEAQELAETAQAILSESIPQPNYTDGSQQYGTLEGRASGKDWLIPVMKQCFGETASRFNHSHDELTISFANDTEKIAFIQERQKEYTAKGWGAYTFNRRTLQSPLALVHQQIEKSFTEKRLPIPNFRVILEPAIIFNRQTTEKHPGNSKANTWGWSSTILRIQSGEDSGYRLSVGGADSGGAGHVADGRRDVRNDDGGFRLAVVLEK